MPLGHFYGVFCSFQNSQCETKYCWKKVISEKSPRQMSLFVLFRLGRDPLSLFFRIPEEVGKGERGRRKCQLRVFCGSAQWRSGAHGNSSTSTNLQEGSIRFDLLLGLFALQCFRMCTWILHLNIGPKYNSPSVFRALVTRNEGNYSIGNNSTVITCHIA